MPQNRSKRLLTIGLALLFGLLFIAETTRSEETLPYYLNDRGTGMPTSMFGTYIRQGELLIYPFFEYYLNNDEEYAPEDFDYVLDEDYRGKYRAYEGLIFLGYGIMDWLAIEMEAAVIDATLETASDDPTSIPDKIQ